MEDDFEDEDDFEEDDDVQDKDFEEDDDMESSDESPPTSQKHANVVFKDSHLPRKSSSPALHFHWLASNALSDSLKLLLVFSRDGDQQSEIIGGVARKLGWRVTEARNEEEATEIAHAQGPDLVIVDRRGPHRSGEADEICRALCSHRPCSIVALVKRSFFTAPDNDEDAVLDLLKIGYSRALMECSHEEILMNELIGIHAVQSQPKSQFAAAQLLYLAIDKGRDVVHLTDDQHVVQFANRASEKLLGYRPEELVGRRIRDFTTNFAMVDEQLQNGPEFAGHLDWKRKRKGLLSVDCRILPIRLPTGKDTYYLYLYDTSGTDGSVSLHTPYSAERGSLNSSEGSRASMATSHSLQLESPVRKIVRLLAKAVRHSSSPLVATQIGQAIDLLRSSKSFPAELTTDDLLSVSNPITADLVEALIDVPSTDSLSWERSTAILKMLNLELSRNESKMLKSVESLPELQELLETCFDWNFDIFKLETLSNRRPLYFMGMTLMSHFHIAERLDCSERTFQNWLTMIESNYNVNVTYHNSTHATDVLQGVARYLRSERLQGILDPLDEVTALLAAATHDIGHPGKTSQFLCNARNKLALLYNDLTVLESHHAALTFILTLSDDRVNIFKNLDRELYRLMRQNIIDMILATEMTKHFEHLKKFVHVCGKRICDTDSEVFDMDVADTTVFLLPENVTMIKRMTIKCADVSNPTRPFRLYLEWTKRIAEEYFDQTDEEKRRNIPVALPLYDRNSCSIPKSQIGFVDFIINDMMEAWDGFIDLPEMIGNMRDNYERWKEFNEQGVMTIEDITRLQETPDLKLYTKSS